MWPVVVAPLSRFPSWNSQSASPDHQRCPRILCRGRNVILILQPLLPGTAELQVRFITIYLESCDQDPESCIALFDYRLFTMAFPPPTPPSSAPTSPKSQTSSDGDCIINIGGDEEKECSDEKHLPFETEKAQNSSVTTGGTHPRCPGSN